jgi:hypothetical protein
MHESSVGNLGHLGADPDPHLGLTNPDPTLDATSFFGDLKDTKTKTKISYN